jgi:hypothetical protein
MRNKFKVLIAAVAVAGAVAVAAPAVQADVAPAHYGFSLGTDAQTYNCQTENSVGPNGWRVMGIGCNAPLQAHDKMYRIVVFLENGDLTERRNGEYRDCNEQGGGAPSSVSFIQNNWFHAHAFLEVVFDTKQGGC